MQTGTYITSDGIETQVTPHDGKKFSLEELQKFVGGMIELTRTNKPVRDMWVNEEGKLDGLPINRKATALYQYGLQDPICGNVLVINRKVK